MIKMTIDEVQEQLDEIIDSRQTVHITSNETEDVLAVLMPIEDYEDMVEELEELSATVDDLTDDSF